MSRVATRSSIQLCASFANRATPQHQVVGIGRRLQGARCARGYMGHRIVISPSCFGWQPFALQVIP